MENRGDSGDIPNTNQAYIHCFLGVGDKGGGDMGWVFGGYTQKSKQLQDSHKVYIIINLHNTYIYIYIYLYIHIYIYYHALLFC